MNCSIIKDLIPLYIDGCCSEESSSEVEAHLLDCTECKELYEIMKESTGETPHIYAPEKLNKIRYFTASALQSVLLVVSFILITVGVGFEAASPTGNLNGQWAVILIIPATGLLISLVNWHFLRLYKSKKFFPMISAIASLAITLIGYIWAMLHYEMDISDLLKIPGAFFGIILTLAFSLISGLLSVKYAEMLGKE